MGRARVVVVDRERAIAEAIAAAIRAALPDVVVVVGERHGDRHPETSLDADVLVDTWSGVYSGSGNPTTRRVLLLSGGASPSEARSAAACSPDALVSRAEPLSLVADAVRLFSAGGDGAGFVSPAVGLLLAGRPDGGCAARFTAAEMRVLDELATRPDTRSRLAHRLGISTSTLDNHVGAIKRKVISELVSSGNGPDDGYLSMEGLIGWATRQAFAQKT